MVLSQNPYLPMASSAIATLFLGFGVTGMVQPKAALTFFEHDYPTKGSELATVNSLMAVYGVRDLFMGLAIYATAWYGERSALGWIMIAGGGVAFVDGVVSKPQAKWNHWGYAPMLVVIGSLLLGVVDRVA